LNLQKQLIDSHSATVASIMLGKGAEESSNFLKVLRVDFVQSRLVNTSSSIAVSRIKTVERL